MEHGTIPEDPEEDDDEEEQLLAFGFGSASSELDVIALALRQQWLRQVNSKWNSIYAKIPPWKRSSSCKVSFVSKVKRIWLPSDDEDWNEISVDEVDLNGFGKDAFAEHHLDFSDPRSLEFRWICELNDTLETAFVEETVNDNSGELERVAKCDDLNVTPLPTTPPSSEIDSAENTNFSEIQTANLTFDLAESAEDTFANYSSTITSICKTEFLESLHNLSELQALLKIQVQKNSVPETIFRQIFSDEFSNSIFAGIADEVHKNAENVFNSEFLTPSPPVTKEKQNSSRYDRKAKESPSAEPNTSDDKSRLNFSNQHLPGSGDLSPYYSSVGKRSKVKAGTPSPRRISASKNFNKPPTPYPSSKTHLGRRFEPSDGRSPVLIDTDWLQRKIEGNGSSKASAEIAAPDTPRGSIAAKKKLMYNYAGRPFYSSEELLASNRQSKMAVNAKSEASTSKTKSHQFSLGRNFSATSLSSVTSKRKN